MFEAGISLKGSEAKSLRDGKGSIADSYAIDSNGELFLINFIFHYIDNPPTIIMTQKLTRNFTKKKKLTS